MLVRVPGRLVRIEAGGGQLADHLEATADVNLEADSDLIPNKFHNPS